MKEKRFSAVLFGIVPVVYVVSGLPAILAGRRALNVWAIYLRQIFTYKSLTLLMPNIYCFLPSDYDLFFIPGLIATVVLIIGMATIIIYQKVELDSEMVLLLASWFHMTCIMFFPAMHERYSYVFIILLGLIYLNNYKKFYIPVILTIIAMLTYQTYLFGYTAMDIKILASAQLFIWGWLGYEISRKAKSCAQKKGL